MVRKETCPHCRGNRYVTIANASGTRISSKCPHCSGNGYRVRTSGDTRSCFRNAR